MSFGKNRAICDYSQGLQVNVVEHCECYTTSFLLWVYFIKGRFEIMLRNTNRRHFVL